MKTTQREIEGGFEADEKSLTLCVFYGAEAGFEPGQAHAHYDPEP